MATKIYQCADKLTSDVDIRMWFDMFEVFVEVGELVEEPTVPEVPVDAHRVAAETQRLTTERDARIEELKQLQLTKLLIVNMDMDMFKKATNLSRPQRITQVKYDELKQTLTEHFAPKPTKFASRYHFTRIRQKVDEKSSLYMERLMVCATDCEFEDLDSRLLDQFVAGLRDEREKARLLKKTNLTLESAREHMLSVERSNMEAQEMNTTTSSGTVNSLKSKHRREKTPKTERQSAAVTCQRCTLRGHTEKTCFTKCHGCKREGHIKRNCPQRKSSKKFKKKNKVKTYHVESSSESASGSDRESENESTSSSDEISFVEDEVYDNLQFIDNDIGKLDETIYHTSTTPKPLVQVKLNGVKLEMEFDSGSTVSIVSFDVFSKLGLGVCFRPSLKTLRVANNEKLSVKGKSLVNVEFNGKLIQGLELYLIDERCPSLMGYSWITKFLGPDWLTRTLQLLSDRSRDSSSSSFSVECCSSKSVDVSSVGSLLPCQPVVQCSVLSDSSSERPIDRGDQGPIDRGDQGPIDRGDQRPIDRGDQGPIDRGDQGPIDRGDQGPIDRGVQRPIDRGKEELCVVRQDMDRKVVKLRKISELKTSPIFQPGLGLIAGAEAKLVLKDGAQPKSLGVRPLPYAKKKQVGDELQRMINEGILSKVEGASPWGTPIVPVFKGEKTRICGSYNLTLNPAMAAQQYPLPSVEECFNKVTGGKKFTKLDVCQAYNNIPIRKEDRILTTINTHLGQLMWNRLPYGIAPAAAIFQETIDQTLAGIPMTCCRVDDILISGKDDEEHMTILNEVISRLENQGYRCKLEKSQFMQDQVIYLGHTVCKDGISPVKSKVEDILKMRAPKSLDELISFLAGVNYYRRYIENMSQVIAPLEELRKKGVKWKWGKEQRKAWEELRSRLSSSAVLTLYNPKLPLKLDTDASSHGLGAVISHIMPDGTERPIEYISRTLTSAEKNYSQIDKEATAIVWAVKRFHLYLYGRKFKLVTDNQPLVHIFNKNKQLSVMTAARLTRWSIFLMDYDYEISYRSTKAHGNADMLSRLPRPHTKQDEEEAKEELVFSVDIEDTCLTARKIESYTKKDPILSKVLQYIMNGWPDKGVEFSEEMTAYWNRRSELSVELGCITWGCRVIIPSKLRSTVLEMLHVTHLGMSGMKTLARSYVYWPLINSEIEQLASTCRSCGKHGKSLPSLTEHPWTKPTMPWQRVHIDYAGPFFNKMWLVVYDAYTRWPEVIKMNKDTTSAATIRALRDIFSRNGLPFVTVSDNGTNFTSEEFEKFLSSNNIRHLKTGTYHPKSNGCCERFVGTFKSTMKRMYEDDKDIDKNLANFLIRYRNTPHSVTGTPPAEAMFKRSLRSRLHQITPLDQQKVESMDIDKEQAILDSSRVRNRQFEVQQDVYVQPTAKDTWREGVIEKRLGSSNMYEVQFDGRKAVKHADHIKKRVVPVLQQRKSPLCSPAGNLESSNRPVSLNVTPHSPSTPRPTETQPTPVTPRHTETQSTTMTSRRAVPQTSSTTNSTPNTGDTPVKLPRRSDRLAGKPRRIWK